MGYIIAFASVFFVFSSSLIANNNSSSADTLNRASVDKLNGYEIIPIKIPHIRSNSDFEGPDGMCIPNRQGDLDDLEIPPSIPSICDPADNSMDNKQNKDISEKINKRLEKLNQKHEKFFSDSGKYGKNGKSQTKDLQLKRELEYGYDNRDSNDNSDKIKKNEDNNEKKRITGLDLKFQKIEANMEKKIAKLKDKIENDRDNQRLIEQQEADEDKDEPPVDDQDDIENKDENNKNYEGYGFRGDSDDTNDEDNDEKNFNFAAAGDFGCSQNTQNTVANMEKKNPELVLALGDLSYHSTADCWFDIMSPLKGKTMITLGHHDIKDGEAKMNQYVKGFELDKPYYSYDYEHVHLLVMATLSDYKEGSDQYNFIRQDLEKASQNEDTNWIIVSTYKPLYSSPSEHPAEDSLRDEYSPLFEKYGVDLVLNGHNHNYQRTYPLTYNPNESAKPTTTSTLSTGYNRGNDGIVFATVGTGGVNFYSLEGKNPYVANQFAGKFGFLNIDISNGNPHSKLTGTFYDNKGGEIADEFTIEKEIKNKSNL
ncbi:MAG: metallophosphoesterase [Nitrososphaeraceae archaeon]|nr:metallophosphoesterase [Nitrososphaeraceae archaeon]MDW0263224.1 metallophosphoesterase [Nitrososphaeraceae archaeon]MDW0298080.1 metallophosphoesterase [Nitrososphaeraceae archaeon]